MYSVVLNWAWLQELRRPNMATLPEITDEPVDAPLFAQESRARSCGRLCSASISPSSDKAPGVVGVHARAESNSQA